MRLFATFLICALMGSILLVTEDWSLFWIMIGGSNSNASNRSTGTRSTPKTPVILTAAGASPSTTSTRTSDTRTSEQGKRKPAISYQLHNDNLIFKDIFSPFSQCRNRTKFALSSLEGVLDFTTTVHTSLKILVMGDSVGVIFGQALQEIASTSSANSSNSTTRTVIKYCGKTKHERLAVSAPVAGGGVVALWRITGMLLAGGKNRPPPNSQGGGWIAQEVDDLLNHEYSLKTLSLNKESENKSRAAANTNATSKTKIDSFDVMIFRIPHGWIQLEQVTFRSLTETVKLAGELFGVATVIFVTIPFSNNVKTMDHVNNRKKVNELVRTFADCWKKDFDGNGSSGVKHVLVQEFGAFTDELIQYNANSIGYDTTFQNYTMERLHTGKAFPPAIAHCCAKRVKAGSSSCEMNSLTADGQHWCMGTIGGRVFASFACLLGCVHNQQGEVADTDNTTNYGSAEQECTRQCNSQFMSLRPVNKSMISTPLASNASSGVGKTSTKADQEYYQKIRKTFGAPPMNSSSCRARLDELKISNALVNIPELFCPKCVAIPELRLTCEAKAQYFKRVYGDTELKACEGVMQKYIACTKRSNQTEPITVQ